MSTDAEREAIAWAEREGRTKRTHKFTIREVRGYEVMADDPCRYILEIARETGGGGSNAYLHALSEADFKALGVAVTLMLNGADLPVVK